MCRSERHFMCMTQIKMAFFIRNRYEWKAWNLKPTILIGIFFARPHSPPLLLLLLLSLSFQMQWHKIETVNKASKQERSREKINGFLRLIPLFHIRHFYSHWPHFGIREIVSVFLSVVSFLSRLNWNCVWKRVRQLDSNLEWFISLQVNRPGILM